ncbi:MAG: energy-coupling factor ABC transporter permease [Candidatus Thermoplasmatota archaeon]|nr:energy-coupling factor ABC transporter permease [Candidatus Thermoplasmatota archaeon]
MHIPDGLMHPAVAAAGAVIAIGGIALALKRINGKISEDKIPTMALLSGGLFIAQMLNFPVGGGTTGHLIGAALACAIAGPMAAMIIMTTILVIQCLLFGDGGITALGLNVLNMAVIGTVVAWSGSVFSQKSKIGILIGAWLSVFAAAGACAAELAISNAINPSYGITAKISVPAMLGYHAIIGIGEAAITVAVVSYLQKVSPKIFINGKPKEAKA